MIILYRLYGKNLFFLIVISLFILVYPLYSEENGTLPEKQTIVLVPPENLTRDSDYDYLKDVINNVLIINLNKIESLTIITTIENTSLMSREPIDLDTFLTVLYRDYSIENYLKCEYYVSKETLHVLINLWDTVSLRIKNTSIHTMPADLDMLKNIEWMSSQVATNVGKILPALEREARIKRQVRSRLLKKLNQEEIRLTTIFEKKHELQGALFTGLNLGRTIVSWSSTGFLLSPSFNLEYSHFFSNSLHFRVGCEYLPFDLMDSRGYRTELSIETLFGFQTLSLSSFTADIGVAIIYDYNSRSSALSYYGENQEVVIQPTIHRLSVSLPIHIGLSLYLHSSFFLNFRFKYHGLTYTFEPLPPSEYGAGGDLWKYNKGFSPWNLVCMSLVTQIGFRF
ncbi:MAG: hypothetical protein JXJ04_07465 [Spirochaetales bacterium]|nr:hypothetical protein [Spirochaetales bacterium]